MKFKRTHIWMLYKFNFRQSRRLSWFPAPVGHSKSTLLKHMVSHNIYGFIGLNIHIDIICAEREERTAGTVDDNFPICLYYGQKGKA